MQFKLAIFLRKKLGSHYKIELERNVNHFYPQDNKKFYKKEIDIAIYDDKAKEKPEQFFIELKVPQKKNGRVPETIYDCLKDIAFLEQLLVEGKSNTRGVFIFISDTNKYCNRIKGRTERTKAIYEVIEAKTWKIHKDEYIKPTGKRNKKEANEKNNKNIIQVSNEYKIDIQKTKDGTINYLIVEVQ